MLEGLHDVNAVHIVPVIIFMFVCDDILLPQPPLRLQLSFGVKDCLYYVRRLVLDFWVHLLLTRFLV